MDNRAGLGERLRYQFDKSMAAGPVALIAWLALISVLFIAVAAAVLALFGIAPAGDGRVSFFEGFWLSLMRTLDPGTMGGDQGWAFRAVALLVTLGGIFVVAALIGVVATALDAKLGELRKGRSRVLESGHTVILNWSPAVFDIVGELAAAYASERRARIVIMADRDKVEMEDELRAKAPVPRNLQIICRSGRPTDLHDLSLVNPQSAKALIVVSPDTDRPDEGVVKTVLALVNDPRRRPEPLRIAAEIRDPANAEVARVVGGAEVQLIQPDVLISRIIAQASRQSGLSAVYAELLDFDGSEIYTTPRPELTGRTFAEAGAAFDACTLIGLADAGGRVTLNPPPDTRFGEGDQAILVAEDDSAIRADPPAPTDDTRILPARPPALTPERVLILGWNHRGPQIVRELAAFMAPGSVIVCAAESEPGAHVERSDLRLELHRADPGRRIELEALNPAGFDGVIVLGDTDNLSAENADTRTLVTLLHLRRILEREGRRPRVVSEMADVRNRELAEVARADDFVVSNKLVSQMLAQAAENPHIEAIFDDLLDEPGSEIYMRPMADYVSPGPALTFATVAESARRRGEVALGYCRRGDRPGRGPHGVVVNPKKSEAVTFGDGDRVIVLAEG